MLNKRFIYIIVLIFSTLICQNTYAQDIKVKGNFLKINKQYPSSGVVFFEVENNTNKELVITKLETPQARRAKIYRNQLSNLGFPERKEVKTVNLRAHNITKFADGRYQVIISGIDKGLITNTNEITLFITFQDIGTVTAKIPVSI